MTTALCKGHEGSEKWQRMGLLGAALAKDVRNSYTLSMLMPPYAEKPEV
jgi:hypothetical protein